MGKSAIVHREFGALPEKRVKLYEKICYLLLEKRQKDKEINTAIRGEHKSILQVLALALMQRKIREFPPD